MLRSVSSFWGPAPLWACASKRLSLSCFCRSNLAPCVVGPCLTEILLEPFFFFVLHVPTFALEGVGCSSHHLAYFLFSCQRLAAQVLRRPIFMGVSDMCVLASFGGSPVCLFALDGVFRFPVWWVPIALTRGGSCIRYRTLLLCSAKSVPLGTARLTGNRPGHVSCLKGRRDLAFVWLLCPQYLSLFAVTKNVPQSLVSSSVSP